MMRLMRWRMLLVVCAVTSPLLAEEIGLRLAMWDDGVESASGATEIELSGHRARILLTWAQEYPTLLAQAWGDGPSALRLRSGKVDGVGRQMCVWEDYIGGTNPLETNDVFHAVIAIENGEAKISWSPELPPTEAAKRVYTVYGKAELSDDDWTPIPDGADKSAYRFFKVGVEMR